MPKPELWAKTVSYACFDCRKHRSLHANAEYSRDSVPCPQCQEPMKFIGSKLELPRKDDPEAWNEFWWQYISPGYGPKGDAEIDAENLHFETCKAKKREPPKFGESTGCERCDSVWRRMPEREKDRWRKPWFRERHWPGAL